MWAVETIRGGDRLSLRPNGVARVRERASLVERAQEGDEAAFTLLVSQRQDQLIRLAWSILRNEADAVDAAQETCIAAWRELPRLRDPERFDAWLTRSLVNRCRDMLRRRRRATIREVRITDEARTLDPADAGVGSSGGGVDDAYVDADAIRRAFALLKPDQRTYLALHYAEDRSIAEISAIVGAPEGTVKWRLSRARQALERQLARQER
jgi:RNA polymerase sigma-70 factor (ECF subfamily)